MRERGTSYSVTLSSIDGFRQAPPGTVADWAIDKAHTIEQHLAESFARAYRAGVKIVLGTDAGTPFNRHGNNAREMALMVQLGMDPLDALRAGTRNSADLLGSWTTWARSKGASWPTWWCARATRPRTFDSCATGPISATSYSQDVWSTSKGTD